MGWDSMIKRTNYSDNGPRGLERKGKECGDTEKGKGHEIIPGELLFEKQDREHYEHRDRDHLLNDLELET